MDMFDNPTAEHVKLWTCLDLYNPTAEHVKLWTCLITLQQSM